MIGSRGSRRSAAPWLLATILVMQAATAWADDIGNDALGEVDIGKGLRAIDMLQDLKAAYDKRLVDCLAAGQAQGYCNCVNNHATLDLTYQQFVEVIRDGDPARAGRRFQIPTPRASEAIAAEPVCRRSP